jgi:hypothetical protein
LTRREYVSQWFPTFSTLKRYSSCSGGVTAFFEKTDTA